MKRREWNENDKDNLKATVWLVVVALGILAAMYFGTLLMFRPSMARDLDGRYANNPLHAWFDSLRSGRGPCCSDADGTALSDVDWESRDGHYRVRVPVAPGSKVVEWVDVPDDAVLTEPNRSGVTMVWPTYWGVGTGIRCFIVGAQG